MNDDTGNNSSRDKGPKILWSRADQEDSIEKPDFTDETPPEPALNQQTPAVNGLSGSTLTTPSTQPDHTSPAPPSAAKECVEHSAEVNPPLEANSLIEPHPTTEASSDRSPAPPPQIINPRHKTMFWLTVPLIVLGLFVLIIGYLNPGIFSMLGNLALTLLIGIFLVFIILGIFVVVGMKSEARTLMNLMFEGGVKYIDIAQTASSAWERLISMVQAVVLLISPFAAVFLAILFYYAVMFLFRAVGARTDVTLLSIILTVALASLTALLGFVPIQPTDGDQSFGAQLSRRFGRVFIDSVEIAVLVIFFTIDSRYLFFLPEHMRGEVQAEMFGIDFMARGVAREGFAAIVRLAAAAVLIEIIRKTYRLTASIVRRYKEMKQQAEHLGKPIESQQQLFDTIREAARKGFSDNLDDFTRFIGFTTILVIAFFFFPRLKLLSLFFFNLTNLAWDLIYPARITKASKSDDLLSRTISKALKL
ncbi:MAG: hypothetical protein PHG63_01400 [Candidatus Dojkabacteria bacterium]|nr:hypothetical protein [Candidatus Dojkabacteria bacterium]